MTKAQDRAADLERFAAAQLGTTRVVRLPGERAPDLLAFELRGVPLLAECKRRRRLPRVLMNWLAQARGYVRDWWRDPRECRPVLVLREHGERALVGLELETFRQIAGIAPVRLPEQPSLPLATGLER